MAQNEKPATAERSGLPGGVRVQAERSKDSGAREVGDVLWNQALADALAPPQPLAERILHVISHLGDASPEEVHEELWYYGFDTCLLTSVRARCTGLRQRGVIRDSGRRPISVGDRRSMAYEVAPGGGPPNAEVRVHTTDGMVDVRLFKRPTLLTRHLEPTPNGFCIDVESLPALISALQSAQRQSGRAPSGKRAA